MIKNSIQCCLVSVWKGVSLNANKCISSISLLYLIWMDNQHSLPVELLHLVRGHQVSHAHRLPAGLPLPQHRVKSGQQRPDVPLLPLDPVQDLQHDNKNKPLPLYQENTNILEFGWNNVCFQEFVCLSHVCLNCHL